MATIGGMPELREGDDVEAAVGETDWVMDRLAEHYVAERAASDACPLAVDERWDDALIVEAFCSAVQDACAAVALHWDQEGAAVVYPDSMTADVARALWGRYSPSPAIDAWARSSPRPARDAEVG